jgi:hypothetical protein
VRDVARRGVVGEEVELSIQRQIVAMTLAGLAAMATLFILPPPAVAQQGQPAGVAAPAEDDLDPEAIDIDPDDAADEAQQAKAAKPDRPQDPLDQQHADSYGRRLDQKDAAGLYRPLDEPPAQFRSDQPTLPDEDWRRRDDAAFEPLGIRSGGLVYLPELDTHLLTTDNIFASHDGREGDHAAVLNPSLKVKSDWSRHEMELFFAGEQRFWGGFPSENITRAEARTRGRVDITSRSSVEAGSRFARDVDGRGSTGLPEGAKSPGVTHAGEVYLQGNHRFNRLGLRLRGTVDRMLYDDITLNDGTRTDNGDRANDNHKLELRASYEFSPRLELFTDWDNNWRRFHRDRDRYGLDKDHRGWLAAAGAKIEVAPTVNVTGRLGYARSTADEASFADIEGLIADTSVVWQPASFITATLGMRTEVDESSEAGVNGSLDHIYDFELKTDWTYRFSSAFVASRTIKDYVDGRPGETDTSLGVKADYAFSREMVLDAAYQYKLNETASSNRENEFRIGLKLRD